MTPPPAKTDSRPVDSRPPRKARPIGWRTATMSGRHRAEITAAVACSQRRQDDIADGPGGRGHGIDVVVRPDQIDEIAGAWRAGRQVGDVEGHQVHGDATHYGQPVPTERGPATIAQRPEIAVGV